MSERRYGVQFSKELIADSTRLFTPRSDPAAPRRLAEDSLRDTALKMGKMLMDAIVLEWQGGDIVLEIREEERQEQADGER